MQCGAFVTNDVAVVSVAFLTLVKKIGKMGIRTLHVLHNTFRFLMFNEFL